MFDSNHIEKTFVCENNIRRQIARIGVFLELTCEIYCILFWLPVWQVVVVEFINSSST